MRNALRLPVFVLLVIGAMACPVHAVPAYLTAFETAYPDAAGSRIDSCNLCHSAVPQRNPYGTAFGNAGRTFPPIEPLDSDGDGATNLEEILALTFPGDPGDAPPPLPSPTPTETPILASPTPTATVGAGACAGDCNGDGFVTIDELLKAVNIALGTVGAEVCPTVDRNGDGVVTIDELVLAVSAALNGC